MQLPYFSLFFPDPRFLQVACRNIQMYLADVDYLLFQTGRHRFSEALHIFVKITV